MPYSISAEPGTPYLFVRLYDRCGLSEARDMLREIAEDYAPLDGRAAICDVRDGHVDVSWREAFELVQFFRDRGRALSGVHWSMIVPRRLEDGIAGNEGLAAVDVPFDYNVSHDPESACRWAGVPVELLTKLDDLRSGLATGPDAAGAAANVATIDLSELLDELGSSRGVSQAAGDIETIDLDEWRASLRDVESAGVQVVA